RLDFKTEVVELREDLDGVLERWMRSVRAGVQVADEDSLSSEAAGVELVGLETGDPPGVLLGRLRGPHRDRADQAQDGRRRHQLDARMAVEGRRPLLIDGAKHDPQVWKVPNWGRRVGRRLGMLVPGDAGRLALLVLEPGRQRRVRALLHHAEMLR